MRVVESVAAITLERPERHNSLVPELLVSLLGALRSIAGQDQVKAVVLQASGRSFSTGGDVGRFWDEKARLAEYAAEIVGLLNQTILAMMELPQPIVGVVQGPVTGGSLGLVLACDTVLVAPEASFTSWYGPVGFAPDGGWTALLPGVIGPTRASHVLLTNATITADQAVEWGLAAKLVRPEVLQAEALALARTMAGHSKGAMQHSKARLRADPEGIARGLEDERQRFIRQITTAEAREGMARFLGIDGSTETSPRPPSTGS
jgi:2-(1,2-epoxy-1,2-dihydrophenyl)acetyl-CoA isomerase